LSLADNETQLEELLVECDRSMKLFCQTFFPHVFFKPFSPMHDELFRIMDDDSIQLAAVAAPRGIGKTSIFNMAFPAKRIVYRDSDYVIPVSATGGAAVEQAEDVKTELLNNDLILEVFGEFAPQDRRDPFGQKEWVTSTGCKVMPRGAGQQVRGRKHRHRRPDLIIVDDLEDDESVENEETRAKLKRWFFSALMNSVDRGSRDWRLLLIGTVLHEDSLLSNLLDAERYPDWETVRLEMFNDRYESNWPDHMSDEDVQKLAASYRNDGLLDVMYREFRNIPVAKETQGFRQEYFQIYEETEEELNRSSDVVNVVLADPARTMKQGSANTAVVGVGVDVKNHRIFVREIIEGRMYPDTLYDTMFEMAERINALVLAPEVTGLNEYITWPLRNEMIRRGVFYVIVEVKPREGKTGPRRSGGLVPMYRRMEVWHQKGAAGAIEKYLLQWPRPTKWDVIDALAGIIFTMEDGEQYFEPPESAEDIEAEYQELEMEPRLDYETVI